MAAPSIVAKLGLDTGDFKKGIADAKKDAQTFSDALKGATAALGISFGVAQMAEFGKASITAAAKVETLQTSFEVMLGSAEQASTLMGDILGAAAATPLESTELAGAAKSLVAFNVSAKDLIPTLMKIGDISSGIGAPIGEIAEIFGKAKVQGRLFAEDINQLTGRGIPVIQEFAKQFGVTDSAVKVLVESGKIGFEQLETAFNSLTEEGGKFHGMMQKQSETTAGKISTMKDAMDGFMRSVGNALNKIGGMDALTNAFGGAGSIVDVLFGNGTNASLHGNSREKSLFNRISSFLDPKGLGLGTTQGRLEYEEYEKRQKAFLEQKAADEAKARQERIQKEQEAAATLDEWQRKQYVDYLEFKEKQAEKSAESIRKMEEEQYKDFLKQREADDKSYLENQAEMYKLFQLNKEKKEKQQERKDEIAQNAKELEKQEADKFVAGELAGPDARREQKRQQRRERRALDKFGRMRDLKERRHGMSKADADAAEAPFMNRAGAEQGMADAAKPPESQQNAVSLSAQAKQFFESLIGKVKIVNVK